MSILAVENLKKVYTRGWLNKETTFSLQADFRVDKPAIIGVMGPNGSGKTTLFELITGSNRPTSGRVMVMGKNIHEVKTTERDRLAIHYHQSYQVRHFSRSKPDFMLQPAGSEYPMVHLFDEPQFNISDGYIGFMLDFFQKLRREGRLVFVCLHPNEPYHIDLLRETCERFIFVQRGVGLTHAPDMETLVKDPSFVQYLGHNAHVLSSAKAGTNV